MVGTIQFFSVCFSEIDYQGVISPHPWIEPVIKRLQIIIFHERVRGDVMQIQVVNCCCRHVETKEWGNTHMYISR